MSFDPPLDSTTSQALVLSPLRGGPNPFAHNSSIIYENFSPDGRSEAVVLYDHDKQAVVAREVLRRTPNRCPLCDSDLSAGSTNASQPMATAHNQEEYFSTLSFMHKKSALVAQDSVGPLRNLPSGLLVTGYYSRFFREVKRLGGGSFGSVFLCNHVLDDVFLGQYAVKKVPVGDNREWLRKMMKEVKALELLGGHPNIVSYKHSWLEMHRANEMCVYVPFLFILMSFCDKGSLEIYLQDQGSDLRHGNVRQIHHELSTWSLFLDITQGLQYLHRHFVLHRDLKPANILLQSCEDSVCGMRAVLSDFGTAEILGSDGGAQSHTGFTGTVEYTAPEVLGAPSHSYTEASDIWSLGIVLFEICFGFVPWKDADPQNCAQKILLSKSIDIPPNNQDTDISSIIAALTERDPAERPSCDDLLFHPIVRQKLDTIRFGG